MTVCRSIRRLKVCKMLCFQWVRFAERGHIGTQIIEPDFLRIALVLFATDKEQHIGLDPLCVENASRQAQNRMKIALVHQVNTNLLSFTIRKENVIRQHHSGAGFPIRFQTTVNMLQKIQLLVAGGVGEIVTGGTFAALLGSERWICEDHIIAPHALAQIGQGITQRDLSLDIMQHGIHQGETVGIVYQLRTCKSLCPLKGSRISVKVKEIIGLSRNVLMGCDHKAKCTASRVVAAFFWLRLHQACHDIDQHTRSKILPCA